MAIVIKNKMQIEKMRRSCSLVKEAFDMLEGLIAPSITTRELDEAIAKFLRKRGAKPSFKNYRGFPKNVCISVNEEVIHGIPGIKRLKTGDIVSIDIGAYLDGFHGDAARTFGVGEISAEAKKIIETTRQSFFEAMKYARKGCFLNDISTAIEAYAVSCGYSIIEEYIGHGVGAELHEAPEIPNYKQKKRGPRLLPGMILAIEPMISLGTKETEILPDGWTVVTKDGSLSCHYENTVLITEGEPEILTI